MLKVLTSISGEQQVNRALLAYASKFNNFKWFLNKVADDFYETEKHVFETEGSYEGKPGWKKLKSQYEEAKQVEYPGTKILHRSGAMERSLTKRSDTNAVCRVTNNTLEIDSNVKTPDKKYKLYKLHQEGWKKPEIVPREKSVLRWKSASGYTFSYKSRSCSVHARKVILISDAQKGRWMKFLQIFMYDIAGKDILERKR